MWFSKVYATILVIGRDNADIVPVHGHEPNLKNFHVFIICWKNCFECQIRPYDSLLLLYIVEIILELFVIAWKIFEIDVFWLEVKWGMRDPNQKCDGSIWDQL